MRKKNYYLKLVFMITILHYSVGKCAIVILFALKNLKPIYIYCAEKNENPIYCSRKWLWPVCGFRVKGTDILKNWIPLFSHAVVRVRAIYSFVFLDHSEKKIKSMKETKTSRYVGKKKNVSKIRLSYF